MIVIADTSPINYLVLIEQIDVLPKLYGTVIIPTAVREELLRPRAPSAVRSWMTTPPDWIEVRSSRATNDAPILKLDAGEREAILLAEELTANYLIIDEFAGRSVAIGRGLPVIGTIGVLRDAARAGLLNIRSVINRLQATSFYLSKETTENLLREFDQAC
jgi:predicted nucleic acid-binding protein